MSHALKFAIYVYKVNMLSTDICAYMMYFTSNTSSRESSVYMRLTEREYCRCSGFVYTSAYYTHTHEYIHERELRETWLPILYRISRLYIVYISSLLLSRPLWCSSFVALLSFPTHSSVASIWCLCLEFQPRDIVAALSCLSLTSLCSITSFVAGKKKHKHSSVPY